MSREPGTTKYKLAEMLSRETGALFEAHDFDQNHPMHIRYEGVCLWCISGIMPATTERGAYSVHCHSWDTMKRCVKEGIVLLKHPRDRDANFEVSAKK